MPKIKPIALCGEEYIEVRKVKWDELWHAYYKRPNGKLTYDRVDKQTAMRIIS